MRYFSWPLVQSVSLSRYAGGHATFSPARGGVLPDDRGLVVWTAGFIPYLILILSFTFIAYQLTKVIGIKVTIILGFGESKVVSSSNAGEFCWS